METTKLEIHHHIARLSFSNPDKRNALGFAMMTALGAALKKAEAEKARVIVLEAVPAKGVWCAGHDIDALPFDGRDPLGPNSPYRHMMQAVAACPLPLIACINGDVWGGGVELALAADVIVTIPDARFALTPAKLGIAYHTEGLALMMARLGAARLREMALTARPVSAQALYAQGVINQLEQPEAILPACLRLAENIADLAPLSLSAMKAQINALSRNEIFLPADISSTLERLRHRAFQSNDMKRAIREFKNGTKPVFNGD